jgi:Raf kinase inhibitor-like YbhB/YbcL family protein
MLTQPAAECEGMLMCRSGARVGWRAAGPLLTGLALLSLSACDSTQSSPQDEQQQRSEGAPTMKITISSAAFADGQPIPKRHTGDGEDLSPALSWAGVPANAQELALIMDDPDAPMAEPWVHWVIYKLPPSTTGLPEGVPTTPRLSEPAGALQGKNSWPTVGYRGPKPPPGHGVHHYHFKLYALDTVLDVAGGLDKKQLLDKMKGHIVAEGELVGTYQR